MIKLINGAIGFVFLFGACQVFADTNPKDPTKNEMNKAATATDKALTEAKDPMARSAILDPKEAERMELTKKTAEVLNEIMMDPKKGIPADVLAKARCVGVFPSVIKAGLILAARRGEGLISCRNQTDAETTASKTNAKDARNLDSNAPMTSLDWSAPGIFNMTGASIGLQAGAQSTDHVLLFMDQKSVDAIRKESIKLGANLGIQAGPIGEAKLSTDQLRKASILSYSRSSGAFAGVNIEGSNLSFATKLNQEFYGSDINVNKVLNNEIRTPRALMAYPNSLQKVSPMAIS